MPEHVRLTDLEQLLLLAVLGLGQEAFGSDIQAKLEDRADRRVSLGSIHVTLARLEEQGLVTSGKTEPRSVRGGKARKVYAVTPDGRAALERVRRVMERMWKGVPAPGGA